MSEFAAVTSSASAGLNWLNKPVPDLDEARLALQVIIESGHRAGDVIKSIRAMFVHESTRRQEVNLNEPIQAVIQIAEPFIKSNGVVLEVYLTDEGPPLVMADPVQLQQVIFNLVINAVEAMAQAGNGARILKLWSQVTPDRTILIRVVDSGPGIDPKIAERLFQPFTTTKASGMGLGLSICREIVEAHSGQLTAFPNKPHGTEFQIILPASDVRN